MFDEVVDGVSDEVFNEVTDFITDGVSDVRPSETFAPMMRIMKVIAWVGVK